MPVVFDLAEGPRRFSELRDGLEGVSPRALALALKDLEAADLVDRRVTDDYPPATIYRLTRTGLLLATLLGPLTAPAMR
jgi:DNA-binding HxlR family transcriptional regulator